MGLDSKHPLYTHFAQDWQLMRDAYSGERAVKEAGTLYLEPTPGMKIDGMQPKQRGWEDYQDYKSRAVFHEIVSEAVNAMVGVMSGKPDVIELPTALEPLRARATLNGESLDLLLRRIKEAQLITGRLGLLLDMPEQGNAPIPYIATYEAERITNWDDGRRETPELQTLNLVVLDETEYERQPDFEWIKIEKRRVLTLGTMEANEPVGIYRQGLFRESNTFDPSQMIEPSIRGNMLNEIPFVFINATDLLPAPMQPPLVPLANLCMTIYRSEADYRQTLFLQGQDTFVAVGTSETDFLLGGGRTISIPDSSGSASFVGVSGQGLPEQRAAIENDLNRADSMSGKLLDTTSREKESGEALKVRVAAQTASLKQIAMAAAEGLQTILRIAARWIGADPETVIVKPNLDFADTGYSPSEILTLAQAKAAGFPLSVESLHAIAKKQGLTEMELKDEMARMMEERAETMKELMPGIQ